MNPMPRLVVMLLAAATAATPGLLAGQDRAAELGIAALPGQMRGDEITARQQEAVRRGLAYLASRQTPEGSWGQGGYHAVSGITALAALSFMSAGNLPNRGRYEANVRKAADFILSHSLESGLLAPQVTHGVMYSHGFATLFIAELYGMGGDDALREKLQRAVRLIEKTQNTEGGWRYLPVADDADISVTICQVMALRAARDAGIKVDKNVIDRAIGYVRRCQNADGGFSYTLGYGGGGGSGFERSAAGVAALYYAGVFEGDELRRGLTYISQFQPGRPGVQQIGHYFYGQYYAAQAMFLAGGDWWKNWYPAIRNELITRQNAATGGWSGEQSEDYCTACALIVLQMPNRYLPVFNGKGPGN